jgi:hypothetical protein
MGFFDKRPRSLGMRRICVHPGCGAPAYGGDSRCRRHAEEYEAPRDEELKRGEVETTKSKRPRLRRVETPERPRLKCRNPKPDPLEAADATFVWLLQEVRLAKQIREHWKHDQVLVAGAERVEREKWRHLIRAYGPDEDA